MEQTQARAKTDLGRELQSHGAEYLGYNRIGGRRREYFYKQMDESHSRMDMLAVAVMDGIAENMGVAFDPEFMKTLKE